MPDLIKIKGGNGSSALADKELAYNRSEKALYIGTPDGNIKLCSADDIEKTALHGVTLDEHTKKINELIARLDSLTGTFPEGE